jgi:hypothetical protein
LTPELFSGNFQLWIEFMTFFTQTWHANARLRELDSMANIPALKSCHGDSEMKLERQRKVSRRERLVGITIGARQTRGSGG